MGAVAWAALGSAVGLASLAYGLGTWWRKNKVWTSDEPVIDLVAAEAARRADDVAFDGIVGHLLLGDPTFADSADRLASQDDTGPAS